MPTNVIAVVAARSHDRTLLFIISFPLIKFRHPRY
jgi:hypothetical protein